MKIKNNLGQEIVIPKHQESIIKHHINNGNHDFISNMLMNVSNDKNQIMMQPGGDYTFNQAPVTEYPMMKEGGGFISNLKKAYVDAYNNYNQRTFPAQTLPVRQKAYRTINPSSYLDLRNYGRWVSDEQREESYDPRSEEAFKFYLGLSTPDELKYLKKSKYIPTINAVDKNYYTVDPQLEQDIFNSYKDKVKLEEILQTDESEIETPISGKDGAGLLGRFGVSRGRDKQGDYLSYYDRYDLKDFAQKRTKGMPYSIYNRIYYPKKEQGGEMIKRADGSYSKRGLWDNIRDNRGSGKVPTKQMLDQERKIKSHYQDGGEEEVNNLKNVNLNLPVYRKPEMNPLSFNKFLVNDKNQNLFIGGINPRYQNENFSVGPYMVGVGNKYFQKFPADMGMSGTYHVNDNFDINMGVGQNNVNAGIKYKFNNGGEPDGEMALGQIDAAINKLTNLRKFIQPNSNLEPWVSSKLTMVDDYANSVSDYMMYNPETNEMMELPIEEMEYGGIPMYGPGGQKQNPPKVYTDKKQFEQAQRMYNDSLNVYNAGEEMYRRNMVLDRTKGNPIPYSKNVPLSTLYKGKGMNPVLKVSGIDYLLPETETQFYNKPSPFADFYVDNKLKKSVGLKDKSKAAIVYRFKKPVQPVIYQPQETINTTMGQVTGTVRPNQIKGSQLTMMINPVRSKENLERMEMIPYTLNNSEVVPRGKLLPMPSKQTVDLTNLIEQRTYPIDIYDRRGNFLRTEFMGNSEGVVDHNYIGEHHYAPRGGNDYIDTNYADGGGIPERYKNMGFTSVGAKKQSTRPGKKWMVLAKKGDDYKVVHGGYKGMQDFKQHHSEQRKENFWSRMGGRNSSKATDPFSPLYWHKRFGTWEEGGQTFAIGGQSTLNPIVKKDNKNWLEYLKN
jgi:hypothetical protein